MTDPSKLRESLNKTVLDSYRDEYKELNDTWKNLEGKAQGAVAIAGIFIAGAFAYTREIGPQGIRYEKIFLGASILCLIISVGLSILALKVRTVAAPPMGEHVDNLVQDLLQVDNDAELLERIPRFVADQVASWRVVSQEANESIKLKAKYLWGAHLCLAFAILTIALLSVLKLLG